MKYCDAQRRALEAGATQEEINTEGRLSMRQTKQSKNNMILALQLHSHSNTPAEWARLAGALKK